MSLKDVEMFWPVESSTSFTWNNKALPSQTTGNQHNVLVLRESMVAVETKDGRHGRHPRLSRLARARAVTTSLQNLMLDAGQHLDIVFILGSLVSAGKGSVRARNAGGSRIEIAA
ncbi:hypothetical protein H105_03292 [Trichophyton soudanense CBS 452.61]|uniref:Uncharacterized protein n=1 Tax=Trichophyton soudanense CBS 452.61 TaxID=1215331 RepID=A0A022XXR6_TRISD|nr:hypothetical protein H102_03275 [Trichophyton rubrum CBS 100081]EZF75088.1 hypothetical protein H105_03292 [Trichophyton soudanense CBS 452.61]EZG07521.1 hypothetical protein H106_03121 [Trichophyton rubrum CBS 735.88]